MKKILFGLLLIISFQAFGQVPTGYQYRRVNERIQGKFMVDSVFTLPRYTDTVQANLHKLTVDTCGAMFFSYTKDSVYYRACNPKRWITVGSGSGGGSTQKFGHPSGDFRATENRNFSGAGTRSFAFDSLTSMYIAIKRDQFFQISDYQTGNDRLLLDPDFSYIASPGQTSGITVYDDTISIEPADKLLISNIEYNSGAALVGIALDTLTNRVYRKAVSPTVAGFSVLGRILNSSGTAVDITARSNEEVLFRNGDSLKFGLPNLLARQGGNQIGFLLDKTSLADTVGLTGGLIGAATYTISSNKLRVQAAFDFSWVRYDSLTSLDAIQLDAVVSFGAFSSATYMANFGLYNTVTPLNGRYSIYGYISTRTDQGDQGRMTIRSLDAAGSETILATSSSDLSMSVNDSIQVKWEKFENTVTFSARNLTTNGSWITTKYTLTGTQTSHSVGSIGILTYTTDYYIHQFKVSSKQVKNPDVYLFGDSKFTKSTYQNESLPALLKNNFGSVYANCAVGSTTAELMLNRSEIINVIKPKKILIESSNDIRLGVSSGTWQANLTQLYNIFTAAGIEVYFTVLYETSVDQSAMDTWLTANYPAAYIRSPWVELQKYGTGILVDGIHLSAIGNKIVADALTLDGKLATDITDHFNYSTAALIPYNSSAAIVHIGLDTLVTSPTYGKLVRKTAGGSTPTLQQVLTAGSTLASSETIATGVNTLTISTASSGVTPLSVTTVGAGIAISALTTGAGSGIYTESGSGYGIQAITGTGVGGEFTVNPSSTNTIVPVLQLKRVTSGTGATGEGGSIEFYNETDGAIRKTNEVISQLTAGGDAQRTAKLIFTGLSINATNSFDTLYTAGDYVTLTESSATTFTSTVVTTSKIAGGEIIVTVEANNTTDFQARTLRFIWSAVNKAGTLTITISTPEEVVALSSGTLTCTITATDAGAGILQFKANAVSSLTQSTLRCSYQTFKNF